MGDFRFSIETLADGKNSSQFDLTRPRVPMARIKLRAIAWRGGDESIRQCMAAI